MGITLNEMWGSLENKPKYLECFLSKSLLGFGGKDEKLINDIISLYGEEIVTHHVFDTYNNELTLNVTLDA